MATYYWVGGTGTWNTSTTTSWASSSGGAGGAGVPTSADSVIINTSSGTGTITCTGGVCLDLTVSATQAITLGAASSTLSVYGSLSYPSGGSFAANNNTFTITFASTATGKTITTNGKTVGPFIFNGVGGGWTLGSALTGGLSSGTLLTLTNGTFNTGNFNITSASGGFTYSATGTATLTLGSSTISFNNWGFGTTTGLTFNANTSTVNLTSTISSTYALGGLTYYNFGFTSTTSGVVNTITGANTFNNLTFSAPSAVGYTNQVFSANQTINGTLTSGGATATNRVWIKSNTAGTPRTLTAAAVSLQNTDFTDITGAGTASPFTGTNLGNATGNSGITFTTKTVYWNLAGAQNWSATGWATSSGGTPAAANFPLPQDTAVFDDTGSVTGTITINTNFNIGTINITNRTTAMTLSLASSPTIYGGISNRTSGSLITLNSSVAGTQRQITYTGSAIVSMDYMSIKDIYFFYTLGVANPYLVYGGANSTNGGNNTGIAFIAGTSKAYILTTGTSWTTPSDWNNSNNTIYMIGAGGGGATGAVSGNNRAAGGGGGGGGYTVLTNQTLTGAIPYTIGTSASNANGGSTTFNTTNIAGGGLVGTATIVPLSTGGAGGTGTYAGGQGGAGAYGSVASTGYGSGGGGGAGGPNGIGGAGGTGFGSTTTTNMAGGGGGGNGGGSAGGNASSAVGGTGGNNFGGIGGGATNGANGTFGGGGAGNNNNGGNGGSGIDIANTIGGAGGKGGAGGSGSATANQGIYGGGGAGGTVSTGGGISSGGAGSQGVIFIIYSSSGAPVSNGNFFLMFG